MGREGIDYEGEFRRLALGRGERCLPASGLGALDGHLAAVAAGAAVLDVLTNVGLAAVAPIAVAVGPSGVAGVLALAVDALGGGVGNLLGGVAAGSAVLDVVAGVSLAAAPDVFVAVSPSGDAHGGLALAVAVEITMTWRHDMAAAYDVENTRVFRCRIKLVKKLMICLLQPTDPDPFLTSCMKLQCFTLVL